MKSHYTLYTGPSMNPLFRAGDGLEVVPYRDAPIRCGDVVVHPHPHETRDVVHRVIAITPEGLRTRGDNNSDVDPYWVLPESIIGRVVRLRRGDKAKTVHGGRVGLLLHRLCLMRRWLRMCAFAYLHPLYHRLADTGVFYGWHKPFVKPRLVLFQRDCGAELQLLAGRRIIARRAPGTDAWAIRFPFELFIDKKSLPVSDEGVSVPENHADR
jgi:signal peptidase I